MHTPVERKNCWINTANGVHRSVWVEASLLVFIFFYSLGLLFSHDVSHNVFPLASMAGSGRLGGGGHSTAGKTTASRWTLADNLSMFTFPPWADKVGDWKKGPEIQTQKPPPEATRQPGPVWTSGSHSLAPCLCLDSCGWVEGQEGAFWCPPDRLPINHLTVWPWANYSTSLCLGSSSKHGDKDSACLVGTLCVYTCIHTCAKSLEPRLVPFTLSVNA